MLDTSIYRGIQPAQIEGPANQLMRALQIQGMMDQRDFRRQEMDLRRQEMEIKRNRLQQVLNGKALDPALPSDVQAALWFMGLPDDKRATALQWKRGDGDIKTIAGVPTRVSRSGYNESQPLSSLGDEASAAATIASAKQTAQEAAKARFDVMPVLDESTGRQRYDTRAGVLGGGRPAAPVAPPAQQQEDTKDAERKRARQAAIDKATDAISIIDKAMAHPGRATATGLSGLADPRNYVRGTNASDFKILLDQIKGKAFLEAFESLKGGGQITQIEGDKATQAIARLNTAQSDDEFVSALNELRAIAARGISNQGGTAPAAKEETRSLNGKTYIKRNGKWFEQ